MSRILLFIVLALLFTFTLSETHVAELDNLNFPQFESVEDATRVGLFIQEQYGLNHVDCKLTLN